ncbi:hypothetical protein WICPIJ_002752 [Wickerhamomyces pijperi]|uniref:CWF19-like protein DRN1 n=1 Tax=Wickerhamomyces pijperi TaxID=599730 RepID=A0A9P8TPI3_WICPI|nr:hypothetical protein WICPIJ_002752 [Wickerhamomyces pijperi]
MSEFSATLVLHPDSTQLKTIITKVNTLNSKSGPFDAVIFLGDAITEPLQLEEPLATSGYLCEGQSEVSSNLLSNNTNITYLPGKYGVFTTVDNLKIAYLTGDEEYLKTNHSDIIDKFTKVNTNIDILITNKWSQVIANEEKLFYGDSQIDPIVELLKPKYHFCVGSNTQGKFFERLPFKWEDDDKVTRFISLAKFGNANKEKWIYAFNLNQSNVAESLPANLTANPYKAAKELQLSSKALMTKRPTEESNEQQHPAKKQRKEVSPKDCFFCLSNPQIQTHMIISIGEHAYLTIAKGPLTKPNTQMSFSGHCLIIPIEHCPCLPSIADGGDGVRSVVKTPLHNEILRYQSSLVRLFTSLNHAVVFYQINKKDNFHFHIQCFPVPVDFLVDFNQILQRNTDINNKQGKFRQNSKLKFQKFTTDTDEQYLKIVNDPDAEYIKFTTFVRTVGSTTSTDQEIYISRLDPDSSLDLQFGRKVMAYLLRTPKRIKWMDCKQSEQRETEETEQFKDKFKGFDFTLQE